MGRPPATEERYQLTELGRQMVKDNIGLPYYLVGRYPPRRRGADPDERLSAAILGLVKAVACYNPGCGVKFAAYAGRVILQEVTRSDRENALIYVPHYLFGAGKHRHRDAAGRALAVTSIHPDAHGGLGLQVVDHRPTEDEVAEAERRREEDLERLQVIIAEMPDRPREVLARVCRGQNQAEIGRELGITREAVRQRFARGREMLLRGMCRTEHTAATWSDSLAGRPS